MYENLKKTLKIEGISNRAVAGILGISENTVTAKLNGGNFQVDEAFTIHNELLSNYDFRYLFTKSSESTM